MCVGSRPTLLLATRTSMNTLLTCTCTSAVFLLFFDEGVQRNRARAGTPRTATGALGALGVQSSASHPGPDDSFLFALVGPTR